MRGVVVDRLGCIVSVVLALQHDRPHAHVGLRRQPLLDRIIGRITRDETEPMAVRMDDDVHEIGIVEGRRSLFEDRSVERSCRRPDMRVIGD